MSRLLIRCKNTDKHCIHFSIILCVNGDIPWSAKSLFRFDTDCPYTIQMSECL